MKKPSTDKTSPTDNTSKSPASPKVSLKRVQEAVLKTIFHDCSGLPYRPNILLITNIKDPVFYHRLLPYQQKATVTTHLVDRPKAIAQFETTQTITDKTFVFQQPTSLKHQHTLPPLPYQTELFDACVICLEQSPRSIVEVNLSECERVLMSGRKIYVHWIMSSESIWQNVWGHVRQILTFKTKPSNNLPQRETVLTQYEQFFHLEFDKLWHHPFNIQSWFLVSKKLNLKKTPLSK
jgi:hypothetical protein